MTAFFASLETKITVQNSDTLFNFHSLMVMTYLDKIQKNLKKDKSQNI